MSAKSDFERPPSNLIESFRALGTATLYEAMGQKGAMSFAIKPLYPGMRTCGPAFTVAGKAGDNLMLHYALSLIQAHDVMVVDGEGFTEVSLWGDIMTTAAQARGAVGLVVDGCVRDASTIQEMGFPVFARGTNMRGPGKRLGGAVSVPIICAGAAVRPGDIVVGDDDGVVVVPREDAARVLDNARARDAAEEEKRRQLRAGKTTVELGNLRPILDEMGFE